MQAPEPHLPSPHFSRLLGLRKGSSVWGLLALGLCVVGARFWLIGRYGLAAPYWDQWEAEGMKLLKPWLEGTWSFQALFSAHNEHRIVLTRLTVLGLFVVNRQWDNQVEMAANAVFCGMTAVLYAWTLLHAFGGRFRRTILLAFGLYFCLPFAWENTLCGFQSQNYYLNFFSLLAVWGLGLDRANTPAWWAGLAGAVLASLSMASGFLAAAVVLVLLVLRAVKNRHVPTRGEGLTALLCVGIVGVGWLTRTEVPGHAVLKAESLPAFFLACGKFLAWPFCDHPMLGSLALVPPACLALLYLRRPPADASKSPGSGNIQVELLLAVSGWAILQTAAIAYGRGGHGVEPSSRYLDVLALVPLSNFFIGLALWSRAARPLWRMTILAVWLAGTACLLSELRADAIRTFRDHFPRYLHDMRLGEASAHGYVATGDFARFMVDDPAHCLPFPNAPYLAAALDDPTLRRILPADLRLPLTLDAAGTGSAFVPGGYPAGWETSPTVRTWGSYAAQGAAGTGVFQARSLQPAGLPYLRFYFAGGSDQLGLRFGLQDPSSNGRTAARIDVPARAGWRGVDFPAPAPDFRVTAEDTDPKSWFAFSEPAEVGFWSRWVGFALRRAAWLFFGGLALAGCLELLSGLARVLLTIRQPGKAAVPPSPAAGTSPLQLLSVVIPARDEEGCLASTVTDLHTTLNQAEVPHEILVVDDGSTDDTARILRELSERIPALRPLTNHGRHGFGRAIVLGLDQMRGDAVVVMMADASDSPADVVLYWRTLQAGYDCAFGSRFVRGSQVVGYPWFKLAVNRLANGFIMGLFRVRCNDTTNAFKAYRREVIEGCRPLISPHFNLTVELPLKAMVRGYRWRVVPIQWHNRRTGAAKFRLKEMGSRYLFICLSIWLEKHLSRGDYRREEV